MTLASIPLMDRAGRRTLHLYGLGGMFIFSIFITISFLIKASKNVQSSNKVQLINVRNKQFNFSSSRTFQSTIALREIKEMFSFYFSIETIKKTKFSALMS